VLGVKQSLQEFLDHLAGCFSSGDIEEIARHFKDPLPIYRNGGVFVEATALSVADTIFQIRSEVLRRGVCCVTAKLREVERKRRNGTPVIVEWTFYGPDDKIIAQSVVRYFCTPAEEGSFRVEMVEYLNVGLPGVFGRLAQAASIN